MVIPIIAIFDFLRLVKKRQLNNPGNPFPHGFVSGSSRLASQRVTHPGISLAAYSLNFGVLMGSEASKPPKGLVLVSEYAVPSTFNPKMGMAPFELQFLPFKGVLITRRASHPSPQGNRRPLSYNSSPPREYSSLGGRHILPPKGIDVLVDISYNWAALSRTALFLEALDQFPRGSPILGFLWSTTRLTSEFSWDPKPVSYLEGLVLN
ncbi:hypothetical protein LguiB_005982 [Lonicera macranthoides]